MARSVGIPYMGNKTKLAGQIVDKILDDNPDCKYFYDLFGGGGSVSFEALTRPTIQSVYYNEYDTGIVRLLEDILEYGVTDKYYQWISRADFHKLKNQDSWLGGLVKTCWSFGNRGVTYLYSPKNEEMKEALHRVVVESKNDTPRIDFHDITGVWIPDDIYECRISEGIQERRLRVMSFVNSALGHTQLQHLESMSRLQGVSRIDQSKLSISNKSYEDVQITTPASETVIYLDPPYAGTGKYQNDIAHNKLLDWVKNTKYKVYVSSYDYPLPVAMEFKNHRCTLSSTNNSRRVTERLFCNQG